MSAVHKRLHQNQMQEFDMLKSLLMEDPAALWRHNKKSCVLQAMIQEAGETETEQLQDQQHQMHINKLLVALNDVSLIPAADPNTSSQTERYLKVMAMRQMAQTNPSIDMNGVDERAFQIMGVDDYQTLFKPPPPGPPGPAPEMILAQAAQQTAAARQQETQNRAIASQLQAQTAMQTLAHKERMGQMEAQIKREEMQRKTQEGSANRMHKTGLADIDNQANLLRDALSRRDEAAMTAAQNYPGVDHLEQVRQHAHDAQQQRAQQAHERHMQGIAQAHDRHTQGVEHAHEHIQTLHQGIANIAKAQAQQGNKPAKKKE
jgi:hypothetical protein